MTTRAAFTLGAGIGALFVAVVPPIVAAVLCERHLRREGLWEWARR